MAVQDSAAPEPDSATPGPDSATPGPDSGPPPGPSECDDGIDNDGDGLVDWAFDPGCYGPGDRTEAAGPRASENGWTTFDVGEDSRVIYVSNDGDDAADGLSPERAVRTITHGASLLRAGQHDFLLLRRGDTWRDEQLGRFMSGRSPEAPIVIGAYGEAMERPRVEIGTWFINSNGDDIANVAIVGIQLVPFRNIPGDPSFSGDSPRALRYVGGGGGLLIEDVHIHYGEIVLSAWQGRFIDGIEIRRNIIERAYHRDTCIEGNLNGNSAHRPSGVFAEGVRRLTLEENFFDHNGWNRDEVPSACATIYNHNVYMPALRDAIVRGNVFSRSSSIHVKTTAWESVNYENFLVEDNFFVGGEIGISIGGNQDGPDRFRNITIRDNVLSQLGRGGSTMRGLSWGMSVEDNLTTVIEDNHLLHFNEGNSYGIHFTRNHNRDVTLRDNLLYAVRGVGIRGENRDGHQGIHIVGNDIIDPAHGSCLTRQSSGFEGYDYSMNRYYSGLEQWFCIGSDRRSFDEWRTESGESDAVMLDEPPSYPDPERTIDTYAASVGLEGTFEAYLAAARQQSRLNWRDDLMASAINSYIRAGFGD